MVADTETSPAQRNPDVLAKEIDRTREELARTIDAIADRVSPAKAAKRAVNRVRDDLARIDPKVAAAGAAVAVGVAAFIIWRRRR
jgi:type VI protein secretion system component VasF